MRTFLKIFAGIILGLGGLYILICSFLGYIFFGTVGFIVQVIIAIALIAGSITLFIKARR